jgi:deoxyxylulose-5-phosphate synthase
MTPSPTPQTPPCADARRIAMLEAPCLVRAYEEGLAARATPTSPGTCTSVGQEAAAVGVVQALEARDRILTNHRSAGHLLARGADAGRLMAEVMGRTGGYCQGAEVIDLRSLKPLDEAAVLASVRKTGRLVVVHEANGNCGVGAEVAARVSERAFHALRAPVVRLTGPDAPAAASWVLEQAAVPQAPAIAEAAARLVDETLAAV